MSYHESNYMKSAKLKIDKLDSEENIFEIVYLQFKASIQEVMLKAILEDKNELRNM